MQYSIQDILTMALRQVGVGAEGTSPTSVDIDDCLMHLNMLLAEWQNNNIRVFAQAAAYCPIDASKKMYTVGPGGDIDLPERPACIRAAFFRSYSTGTGGNTQNITSTGTITPTEPDQSIDSYSNGIDFPLQQIESLANWSGIMLKNISSTIPCYFNYNPAFPLGEVRLFPAASNLSSASLHIVYDYILPHDLAITDTLNLPSTYFNAIMWNLACRIAISYGQEPSPTLMNYATSALRNIAVTSYRPITVNTNPNAGNMVPGVFLFNRVY